MERLHPIQEHQFQSSCSTLIPFPAIVPGQQQKMAQERRPLPHSRGDSDTVPGFGLAWALPVVGGPGESEPTDEGWKIISLSLLFIIQIKTKYTIQTATVDNRRPIPTQRRVATPLRCYSVSLDFHFLWKLSQEFIYILGFSSTCL